MRKFVFFFLFFFSFVNSVYAYSFLLSPVVGVVSKHFGNRLVSVGVAGLGAYLGSTAGYIVYDNIKETLSYSGESMLDVSSPVSDSVEVKPSFLRDGNNLYEIGDLLSTSGPACWSGSYSSTNYVQMTVSLDTFVSDECSGSATLRIVNTYRLIPVPFDPAEVEENATSDLPISSPSVPTGAAVIDDLISIDDSLTSNVARVASALDSLSPGLGSIADVVSVGQLLGNLPSEVLDDMPLAPWERNLIDSIPQVVPTNPDIPLNPTVPQEPIIPLPVSSPVPVDIVFPDSIDVVVTNPVDISVPSVPSIPDLPVLPSVPDFDITFDVPESSDWFSPAESFYENLFSRIPFMAVFQSASIESSSGTSVVVLPMMGENVSVDFSDYESVLVFMSVIIVFGASVWAVLIIVER